MAIVGSDFLVVNRGGVDYKTTASELGNVINSNIGDGTLTIKASDGTSLGTFTANQAGGKDIVLPAGFTGSWNDLTDKPEINDAALTIRDSAGNVIATFTANASVDVFADLPAAFSGSWNDLTDKPTVFPPDPSAIDLGLGELNDVDDTGNEGDVLTKLADGSHGFLPFEAPPALRPMGTLDVSLPAPADPVVGDLYQQHRDDAADATAVASFTGIAGKTATEGQIVFYGADDQWHLGASTGNGVQAQSDWAETDTNAVTFIKNKPTIGDGTLTIKNGDGSTQSTFTANQEGNSEILLPEIFSGDFNDLVNKPAVNDGQINIAAGSGLIATGDNATANQAGNTTRTLAVNAGIGININADGSVELDLSYINNNIDSFPEAPDDGAIYARNGDTKSWERAMPYDISQLDNLPDIPGP